MMKTGSLTENQMYRDDKPAVQVLLKTATSKEIRIMMKRTQVMKEHKAPFPIVIELFEGAIDFGVNGKTQFLKKGDLIALDANVPHDLRCVDDCIIRLSVSTLDNINRIKKVI